MKPVRIPMAVGAWIAGASPNAARAVPKGITAKEILEWRPMRWADLCVSADLMKDLKKFVVRQNSRKRDENRESKKGSKKVRRPNRYLHGMLLVGPDGTSKSTLSHFVARCIGCLALSIEGPCGKRSCCKDAPLRSENVVELPLAERASLPDGVAFSWRQRRIAGQWSFGLLECKNLCKENVARFFGVGVGALRNPAVLLLKLDDLDASVEQQLKTDVEMNRQLSWIGTAANIENVPVELDKEFPLKLGTEAPGVGLFAEFIGERCRDWKIIHNWGQVCDLADAANGSFEMVMSVLAAAADNNAALTNELITNACGRSRGVR